MLDEAAAQLAPLAHDKGIHLHVAAEEVVPDVFADRDRVAQVLGAVVDVQFEGELPATVALSVPPSVLPSQVPLYVQDLDGRKGHELSLSFQLLARDQYGRDAAGDAFANGRIAVAARRRLARAGRRCLRGAAVAGRRAGAHP